MAGSHTLDCSHHPAIERDEPTLSGTHGNVVEDDASDHDVVDAEFDADVDGKSARVKVTKRRRESSAPKPELTRLPPPRLKNAAAAVYAIQRALDDKEIFGIHQALTKTEQCSYEWFDEKSQQSVGCFAAAVFDFEDVETCPTCNKTSKNIKEPLCLVHMGMRQMDELPARQTDMFDHDEHGDPEPE